MSNTKDFKVKNGIKPTVYHEAVGTVVSGSVGYNVAGASYDSKSFSVNSQLVSPTGVRFNSSGTKMFVSGYSFDDINEYDLSTAWDVSTSSYSQDFSVASQTANPYGFTFKPDGTKMYVTGYGDALHQYSLSTAFDLSSASYDSKSLTLSGQDLSAIHAVFNDNGTKVFMIGTATDTVYQYSLSTAYDVSTGSYDSVSFSVSSQQSNPRGLAFNGDGTEMYVIGFTSVIYIYSLSTGFDLSTAYYSGKILDLSSEMSEPHDLTFSSDGSKMYIISTNTDSVHQYSTTLTTNSLDLSTGSVFEITPTSDIQVSLSNPAASGTVSQATLLLDGVVTSSYDLANASYDSVSFSVASQETVPTALSFKSDGTKMYVVGSVNNTVNEYNLSTAWDISTASYLQNFSVAAQEAGTAALFFKPDGTKMYISGYSGDDVNEYTLSTAWDVSTASYVQNFSVAAQETSYPSGIAFKTDGTIMYVVGGGSDAIHQYSLNTAWDISTASFVQSFSVSAQETGPSGLFFKPDGFTVFIVGFTGDDVNEYDLSTAWDISTASYVQNFSIATQDIAPHDVFFKTDDTKMYIIGNGSDSVHQYSTATTPTITYDPTLQWPSGTAPTSPAVGETDVITFSTTDGGTTYQAAVAIDGAS